MSRTRKDTKKFKDEHWMSIHTPSWFNKDKRRAHRSQASQDLRNGREPLPKYKRDGEYYW